jgi:hypothetical protein
MTCARKSEKCRGVLIVYDETAGDTSKHWIYGFGKLNIYKWTSRNVTPTQIYAEMLQLASGGETDSANRRKYLFSLLLNPKTSVDIYNCLIISRVNTICRFCVEHDMKTEKLLDSSRIINLE